MSHDVHVTLVNINPQHVYYFLIYINSQPVSTVKITSGTPGRKEGGVAFSLAGEIFPP